MLDPGTYQRALQQRQGGQQQWPPMPGTMFSQDAPPVPRQQEGELPWNTQGGNWPPVQGNTFQQDQQQQQPDILQLLMMILGQ